MSKIKYAISGTMPDSSKKATVGYELFETDDLKDFIEYINTHATVPCSLNPMPREEYEQRMKTQSKPATMKGDDFNKGYKATKYVNEILPWFRLDLDKEGEIEQVEKKLKKAKVFYIKKPSTSHAEFPYKWHIFVPAEGVSQSYDAYQLQYYAFLSDMDIDIHDNGFASIVKNANGMGADGEALSSYNDGAVYVAPHREEPTRPKLKAKKFKGKKLKAEYEKAQDKLEKLDASMKYDEWFMVAQTLHSTFGDAGFKLFDEWSSQGDNYDAGYTSNKWDELNNTSRGEVNIGTLYKMDKKGFIKEEDKFDNEKPLTDEQREKLKFDMVKSIPDELKNFKQLNKDMLTFYRKTSKPISLFASITVVSACAVKSKVKAPSIGIGSVHLFMLLVAPTGKGKGHIQKVGERLRDLEFDVASSLPFSPQGVVVAAERFRNGTILSDEFGQKVGALIKDGVMDRLREMYDSSTMNAGIYMDESKNLDDVRNPSTTFLGVSTPEELLRNLDATQISNGTVNRFISVVDNQKAIINKMGAFTNEFSKPMKKHIKKRSKSFKGNEMLFSPDATTYIDEFMGDVDERGTDLHKIASNGLRDVATRMGINTMRLSISLAHFEGHEFVSLDVIKYSYKLIKELSRDFLAIYKLYWSNEAEDKTTKFLEWLEDTGETTHTVVLQKSPLRSRYIKAPERTVILNELVENGIIEKIEEKNVRSLPKVSYKLVV